MVPLGIVRAKVARCPHTDRNPRLRVVLSDVAKREEMARRIRALVERIPTIATDRQLINVFAEWRELEEWWAHQPTNDEALSILVRVRENAAWVRAQRRFRRARQAQQKGRGVVARLLWEEGRSLLDRDWRVMYRREPVPDVPVWDDS